jgi:four helix bundle protein
LPASLVVRGFEDLEVYRRAARLANDLYRAVARWPSFDRWSVGLQMIRAADSIGANLAEGSGRFGSADHRRFLFIARGSACELQHWIGQARARRLDCPDEALAEAARVTRMLNGLIRNMPGHH